MVFSGIGNWLKLQRENAGLSIGILSERSGVEALRIEAYENDATDVPLSDVEKFADSLSSSRVDFIFECLRHHFVPLQNRKNAEFALDVLTELYR